MLSARPARARHVRALSVFPDCSPLSSPPSSLSLAEESVGRQRTFRWGRGVLPDGYAVSSVVRRAARRLEVLSCFVWDGEELPPYDDMWFALRISCVSLLSLFVDFKAASFILYRLFLAARTSSSSRRRLDPSCLHRTAMCVCPFPSTQQHTNDVPLSLAI